MKIYKSKIVRTSSIDDLPCGKAKIYLGIHHDDTENICVARDEENKVMYLLNHAFMFYPYPSWGMELPLQSSIDLFPYRGNTSKDAVFTVCEEAYEHYKKYINEETHEFDTKKFLEDSDKLRASWKSRK